MECILYSCKFPSYRRNLCKYHYRCRQMLTVHCTQSGCIKPLFAGTLFCRRHFREEYATCIIANCPSKTYTTHMCRRHYRQYGNTVEIPKCAECDKDVFVFGKCIEHCVVRKCLECDRPVRAKGLCVRHYFKQRRRVEDSDESNDVTHLSQESSLSTV